LIDANAAPDQPTASDISIAGSYGESVAIAKTTPQSINWFIFDATEMRLPQSAKAPDAAEAFASRAKGLALGLG
jgi:hypothetical protein